jgi:hypothetical protein
MIENGLTKKINPNTNIFNSAINAVLTFKDLYSDVTMKRQTARVYTGKTRPIYK